MLYKQDIANLALGRLGVSLTVVDLETENSNQAKVIRRHFRMSLDTLLEAHEWGFATGFSPLPLVSENPNNNYAYEYGMPVDCLVLRLIAENGIYPSTKQYEYEKSKWREVYTGGGARRIYTNVNSAHGEYTVRLPEDIAFPTHFGRALSAQLALDIAPQLITNNFGKVKNELFTSAKSDITLGIAADLGREPQLGDSPSPFIAARLV